MDPRKSPKNKSCTQLPRLAYTPPSGEDAALRPPVRLYCTPTLPAPNSSQQITGGGPTWQAVRIIYSPIRRGHRRTWERSGCIRVRGFASVLQYSGRGLLTDLSTRCATPTHALSGRNRAPDAQAATAKENLQTASPNHTEESGGRHAVSQSNGEIDWLEGLISSSIAGEPSRTF